MGDLTAVEQLTEAIAALDTGDLLDDRARTQVLAAALAAFKRERNAALARRDSLQLTFDAERAA